MEQNRNDIFLMIRRKKTTIFIDVREETSVLELKRMVAGILKIHPEDQRLYKEREEMKDNKNVGDYGLNASTAKPQLPPTIALVCRNEHGEWEEMDIAPLSQPPELPEVMRQPESSGQEQNA